jgi:lysophospholipase L1-like esterase
LKQILRNDNPKLLVGIPNVFGATTSVFWINYLANIRNRLYQHITCDRHYVDACVTRVYGCNPANVESAQKLFTEFKKIWNGKDVIFVGDNNFKDYIYINTGDEATFCICYLKATGFIARKYENAFIKELTNCINTGENEQEEYFNSFAFAGIPVVGIIGDSLSSGVTYKSDNTPVTDYNMAWWRMLKRDSGMEYKCFATGGLTTRSWLSNTAYGLAKALTPGNECCAYVIALGVNDEYSLGTGYLGSANDIDLADYTNNADTFYGNYARIIQRLTELVPSAKFFAVTIPRTSASLDAFNDAIREISGLFSNSYVVDLAANYLSEFSTGFLAAHNFGGAHQSAAAYQVIGKLFEKAISDTIVANAIAFRYIQFALDSVS